MELSAAVALVRAKFLEEKRGTTDGPVAERYAKAIKDYPVTMMTAQAVWNQGAVEQS